MRGFRPTSRRTHERHGACSLCGLVTELTDTHVPPKSAFNDRPAQRGVLSEDDRLVFDRARDGGFRLWGHCESCRRQTSPWDDEYLKWVVQVVHPILRSDHLGLRSGLAGELQDVRPGRFIRAAAAGMTALAEGLLTTHREFVDAVRTGQPWSPVGSMRFLLGVTPSVQRPGLEGGHQGVTVLTNGSTEPTISAAVHFPPFSILLAEEELVSRLPHADCTAWLTMGVDESHTRFPVELPAVQTRGAMLTSTGAFQGAAI